MSHPNHFTGSNLPTEGYPPFAGQPPLYAAAGVPPFMGAHPTQQVLLPPAQSLPPGTAVLQQPFPGQPGPQKDKLESALDFLEQVKAVFENRLEVYNQFLDIMKEFKAHSIDTPGVIARVKELFKGHPKLVFGFNTFLPPGYKIDLAEVEAEEEQRKRQEQQKREASATKGEAWDAQSAAAQKKYPEEFDQARNYVRKIKVRFEYQPHIYKAFLEILHTYHNKQHTIQEVYQQVARLFKDNPDLLEEFKQFLPDPANQKRETAAPASQPTAAAAVPNNNLQGPRGRSTRSNPPRSAIANQTAAASETSRRPTRERSTRGDDASKSRIDGSYGTFTEHSYFFRIKSYLGPKRYPEFLKCLTLFNQEIITKYELVLLARDLLRGEYELLNWFKEFVGLEDEELSEDEGGFSLAELDLSNSEQCTPSYRALPEKYRVAKCSGRTRLCASVLNDTWISVPIGSEDGTFKNSRKNQYEELLFKCEDDRYEFDLLIENNTSTIKALESLLRKIKTLAPEEVNSYELTDKDELEQLQYKSIKKVYGTRGKEMVDSLKKYPAVAIPVVLARLKQKDIEWSKAKREWNKVWRQINERNYHKSLDHMGSFFKQDEKKFLSPKTLLQDVAKAMDPISPMPSQLNFEFKHAHIFDDIKRLMQVTFEKSIGRTDREKADKLVKQVFSELFSLNPHRVEDSASDVKPLNTAGTSSTNTSRIVFLGNDNQYLLFRYIQVLYQRLERAREMSSIPLNQSGNWSVMKDVENGTTSNIVSIKTDERMEVDSTRELAVGTTMLSNVPVVQPLDEEQTMQRYNKFMDELVKLISGAVEQGQFEDEARLALGTGSFMLFTLDKVVGYLCKQVHVVLGDQQSDQLLGLYNYEFARTQEGSANEQVYINNAAQLLQNGRCYLFAFEVNSSVLHLTIEYIALESGKATKVDVKPLPSNDNSGAGSGAGNNNNSTGSSNNGNAPSGPGNSSPNSSGGNSSPSGNGSMPPASTLSYNARELEQWSRYTNQLLLADHPHHIITHLFLNRNLKKNKKNMDKVFANIQVHNDLSSMIDVRTLKTRYVEHTEDWFYRPKSADRAARADTNKRSFSPSLFNKMKS